MNVEVPREQLREALALLEKISGKHLTLPILQCVLLSAKDGQLTLRATNLEIGIERVVSAKVEKEGVAAIPTSVLSQVVAAALGNSVTLSREGTHLTVTTEQGASKLNCFDESEFPTLPRIEGGEVVTLPAEALANGVRTVAYAASQSSIKPELASIYLYSRHSDLICVATDSFRLGEKRLTLPQAPGLEGLLLPIRSTPDLLRALELQQGDVSVTFNENQLSCAWEGVYVTMRLVDGVFPDYQQIVPKEFTTEAVFLKQDILQVLRKSLIFSDKFNQVNFKIEPKKKKCTIAARNAEVGEMSDTVPAALSGDDIHMSFNQRYILDCFQSIASDSVSFSFCGVGRPLVIQGVSDASFFYLVMPMNT